MKVGRLSEVLRLAAIAVAAFCVLFLPENAACQRRYAPDLSIGGKAGATLSQMSFSPKVSQSFLPGFTAGFVARYTEEKICGIVAEFNIEQRGWKETADPSFRYSRTLTYLQLPLLTHIRFGSQRFKAIVNLGPQIGYMIASKASMEKTGVSSLNPYLVTEQHDMAVSNRFDYGIAAGIGAEWRFARRQSVMIEGRFYYGLGNIFPAAKKDYFSASRGMSIEITAAYLIRIY